MEPTVNFFVSINRAYRSEIALYREERRTTKNCAVIQAPEGTRAFYAVENQADAISIWTDMHQAFQEMLRCKGRRLHTIAVM